MTDSAPDHDRFAMWDGAYVLGALSAPERAAFEEHLDRCVECTQSVGEFGELPELLSVVPIDVALGVTPGPIEPTTARPPTAQPSSAPPTTLLSGALRRVARERRRRRWRVAATALAAACAAAAAAILVIGVGPSDDTPQPSTAMSAVVPAPIRAVVGLRSVQAGTEITVICSYDGGSGYAPARSYALRVTGRDGQTQQISTWRISPGGPVTATSTTSLDRAQIESVEITTSDGRPVLRLTV